MSGARKPDLLLKAMDTTNGARSGKLGAAWINEDGSVSLRLDPGVGIHYAFGMSYMLFPNDREDQPAKEAQTWHPQESAPKPSKAKGGKKDDAF